MGKIITPWKETIKTKDFNFSNYLTCDFQDFHQL